MVKLDEKARKKHEVSLIDRKKLVLTAIKDVFSFDEQLIKLETISDGFMDIKGTKLHIIKINLESGELIVEGNITSIIYDNGAPAKKKSGLFRIIR